MMEMSDAPEEITPAAQRMRNSRARRRDGLRTVRVDVHDSEIDVLVRRGYLDDQERDDRELIGLAIAQLLAELDD